uniref:Uncharacterized protein n=1 Tax=Trichogramma kaykai TaxID=54128 RepID=A0ABD2VZG9_9HYME
MSVILARIISYIYCILPYGYEVPRQCVEDEIKSINGMINNTRTHNTAATPCISQTDELKICTRSALRWDRIGVARRRTMFIFPENNKSYCATSVELHTDVQKTNRLQHSRGRTVYQGDSYALATVHTYTRLHFECRCAFGGEYSSGRASTIVTSDNSCYRDLY